MFSDTLLLNSLAEFCLQKGEWTKGSEQRVWDLPLKFSFNEEILKRNMQIKINSQSSGPWTAPLVKAIFILDKYSFQMCAI